MELNYSQAQGGKRRAKDGSVYDPVSDQFLKSLADIASRRASEYVATRKKLYSSDEIERYRMDSIVGLQKELSTRLRAREKEITDKITDKKIELATALHGVRDDSPEGIQKQALALERLKIRYSSMSDKELDSIIKNQLETDSLDDDEFDVLTATLANRKRSGDIGSLKIHRQTLNMTDDELELLESQYQAVSQTLTKLEKGSVYISFGKTPQTKSRNLKDLFPRKPEGLNVVVEAV